MKRLFTIVCAVVSMAACSKETSAPAFEGSEVFLELRSEQSHYASESRQLPEGTRIGVWGAPYGQPATATPEENRNLGFTASANGALMPDTSPLRVKEGEGCTLYAYAPYKSTVADPEAILFSHGEDVLGCPESAGIDQVSPDHCSAVLSFVHLTAQIRFVVVVDGDSGLEPLGPGSVIRISGFLPEGTLRLSDAVLTGSGDSSEDTDITAVAAQEEPEGDYGLATSPVCFFTTSGTPQILTLRVTHGGVTRTGSIVSEFTPGESLTYTVRIGRVEPLLLTATLTPWIYKDDIIEI